MTLRFRSLRRPSAAYLEFLKQTHAGQDTSATPQIAFSKPPLDEITFPLRKRSPSRDSRPGQGGARGCAPQAARSPRPRAPRPAALGPFESPARATGAGQACSARRRRGRAALARSRRGPASSRAPCGAGEPRARTRASLPPGFTWGRRRATRARAGNGPGPPATAGTPAVPALRATLRSDPPRVTGTTYLAAGPPQGTPPIAGPAENCPRACALRASGPDPGPEKKTKGPAAPGGRPGKCKWRALARALLTSTLARVQWVYILETPNRDKWTDNQKEHLKSEFVWEDLVWTGLYGQIDTDLPFSQEALRERRDIRLSPNYSGR